MTKDRSTSSLENDGLLQEQAYLIGCGIRPAALIETIESDKISMVRAATLLERAAKGSVIPFVIDCGDGTAICGFAQHRWSVEALRWLHSKERPPKALHSCLMGLLLGYGSAAIEEHWQADGRLF